MKISMYKLLCIAAATCASSSSAETIMPECAMALTGYRESNGTNFTQVHLDCLSAPTCAGAAVSTTKSGTDAEIVCDFEEHTDRSDWAECVTNYTEDSKDVNSLSFSGEDFTSNGSPLIGVISNYSYMNKSDFEWGLARGCGSDEYVYILFRNPIHEPEPGLYSVVGFTTLNEFMNGDALSGTAGIDGQGISGINSGSPCAFGWEYTVELQGSCQFMKVVDAEKVDDENVDESTGGQDISGARLLPSTSRWLVATIAGLVMLARV